MTVSLLWHQVVRNWREKVNISTSKLSKGFNSSLFGTSVHAYIIDQRLEKAASLLLESNLNVSQVAAFVGYSKPSNFAAAFKKKYGVIPKNYKDGKYDWLKLKKYRFWVE